MELGQLACCGEQVDGEAHCLLLAAQHLLFGMEVAAEVGKAALAEGPEALSHRWTRLNQHLGVAIVIEARGHLDAIEPVAEQQGLNRRAYGVFHLG